MFIALFRILLGQISGLQAGNLFWEQLAPRSGRLLAVRFFGVGLRNSLGGFLFLALLLGQASPVIAANPGDLIVNTAQLSTTEGGVVASTVTVQVAWRTASTLELLHYLPGASPATVSQTFYSGSANPSGPFSAIPAPTPVGSSSPLNLTQPIPLAQAEFFHQGNPLLIRLTDGDQNINSASLDFIFLTVSCGATGDTELLRLTETGVNTGIFTGYLPTRGGGSSAYDGLLAVEPGAQIEAHYVDAADGSDASASAVLVDPYGVIINSRTGQPVNGVTVTLVDAATGAPATVFADDGVTSYPATVTTGGTVTDGGGTTYTLPLGSYRYPLIQPGTYRLILAPPSGFSAPSTVSIAELQTRSGAPFALLDPGSFGGTFTVTPGPPLKIDLPVDPNDTALWVRKTVAQAEVAIGDFLQYQVQVENTLSVALPGVHLVDQLPLGFRYQQGSARMGGVKIADPTIALNGRSLTFPLGNLDPLGVVTISYVAEVAAGARPGKAVNQASATSSDGFSSNRGTATVKVREDFLRSRTLLMGQVTEGRCDEMPDPKQPGLPGIRIFLEDGTFVQTDTQGMFHFEGLRPGVHVVQLDLASLPPGYRPVACDPNTRFAGSTFSQFIDLQGGTMWRSDFRLMKVDGDSTTPVAGEAVAVSGTNQKSVENPEIAKEGILSFKDGQLLVDRVNAVRIRLKEPLKPKLLLDGVEIPEQRIGFRMKEEPGTVLYSYIGVDFGLAGAHRLQLQGVDPFGNARFDQTFKLVRTGAIAGLKLLETGNNIADNARIPGYP